MSAERVLGDVIAAVSAREEELVTAMVARNVDQVPDLGLAADEPEVVDAVRESARGNLRAALAAMARDRRPPDVPPIGALEEARAAARAGVPLEALVRTYRVGQAVALDAGIHEVERLDLDRCTREEVLRLLARFSFAYVDTVVVSVAEEYQRERSRLARGYDQNQRRLDLVLSVLDGITVDRHDLGYDLNATHLGVVIWGPKPVGPIQALAAALDRPMLCVAISERTAWGWVGGVGDGGTAHRQIRRWDVGDAHAVALGEPARDGDGFRQTHHQARRAQLIGIALGHQVTRFSDVAFECLAMSNDTAAYEFVARELRPLRRARDENKLRETLRAYFAAGLNASAAAVELGVHDRTVAYRIGVIENLLGAPLLARRFTLEAALRLEPLVAASRGALRDP